MGFILKDDKASIRIKAPMKIWRHVGLFLETTSISLKDVFSASLAICYKKLAFWKIKNKNM